MPGVASPAHPRYRRIWSDLSRGYWFTSRIPIALNKVQVPDLVQGQISCVSVTDIGWIRESHAILTPTEHHA
jgi:hypothetical protein